MQATKTAPEADDSDPLRTEGTVQRDLALDREMIETSGMFDPVFYSEQAGAVAQSDPIGHYLEHGWRLGFEPHRTFPGMIYAPYFEALGFNEPPALTWLTLRAAGWPIPPDRGELEAVAHRIRASGLFHDAFYLAHLGKRAAGIDPGMHYAAVGEKMGLAPSPAFDPLYYAERYPDVVAAGLHLLRHYVDHGRAEGRLPLPGWICSKGSAAVDPKKENILLVVHETSRTGAPILGWNIALQLNEKYNLFGVRLGGGDLMQEFENVCVELHGPPKGVVTRNQVDIRFALKNLLDTNKFLYAIVNSAESRHCVELFVRRSIPTLLLMHEFGSYVHPIESLRTALDWSTELIFPSQVVARAAQEVHPILKARSYHMQAQGMSILPEVQEDERKEASSDELDKLTKLHDEENVFVVLGAGAVHIRKGVDLFLAAAANVKRSHPSRTIHFLWVGHGYKPVDDMSYSVYLKEQLNRSELRESVTLLDAVPDLEPVYRIADAFFLSSRLDPMPNVSIDAAMRGIPVVCFREASGTAELMMKSHDTAGCVVDHLDAESAARVIVDLASDAKLYQRTADATRKLANESFDMKAYVARLDEIGTAAGQHMQQRAEDLKTLLRDGTFDQDMFLGTARVVESREATLGRFLALSDARGWDDPPVADTTLRRPAPGFNPRVYFQTHAERLSRLGINPFADFVRSGKLAGPWQTRVIRPQAASIGPLFTDLKTALHAHFYYPELAHDFLTRLNSNEASPDLFISTDKDEKALLLARVLKPYQRASVTIEVMPNKGRDIGPLLTGFAKDLEDYDIVGHVHAKRSLFDGDGSMGDRWREFLWQNLLGGQFAMLEVILSEFLNHAELGLIFPSDPHLIGWDENRKQAGDLMARMGLKTELPQHFDFPLGTMFWMRRQALQPLLDLQLDWDDYPEEPLPYDGTILHALERLTPAVAKATGFESAVTHVFGVSW